MKNWARRFAALVTILFLQAFAANVAQAQSISISASPAAVSEDGATNLTYTVTRSGPTDAPLEVALTWSGTATSGSDYTGTVSSVVIQSGSATATFAVNPTVDGTVEADETVVVTVAPSATSEYTVGVPSSATGTILNDDVPSATISVSPGAVAEDGAPNLIYTVTLNQASFVATNINYTIGGTASNGSDFATIASPLVIPAGTTTRTITVNPTADASIEGDETVTLALGAGAGYTVGFPSSATGTILNDDLPNLSINDVTTSEGGSGTTNATFSVNLSAPAGPGGVTFNIATANGTATAGIDYVASSLTGQTIPAGSSSYTFTVMLNGDVLNEPSETFFVNVTSVTNAVVVDGQGVGTVVNDDPLPSLSINDVTVVEGGAGTVNAVFTVSLSAASGQSIAVNYSTADGTATQSADYTDASGTLTFTPGITTRTVNVPVIGEGVPEANEVFFVNLSGAINATVADNQGQGLIVNDDVPVTISPTSLPSGSVASAYSQTLSVSGGSAPYSTAITAGSLPAGLSLSSAGVLSGTPTAGGTFNFTVTATDSSPSPGPFSGSRAYSLTIAAPEIQLSQSSLASGTLGSPYSATITTASGGTAPYYYAVTAGSLPGGLTLNSATGAITGTPSASGTFNFSITASDGSTGTGPYTATQAYLIQVTEVAPALANSQLTVAYNAPATNVSLSLSGGEPSSLAIVAPPLHGTATVSGLSITYQPEAGYAGSDAFTYNATNSGGTSAPATVSITVQDPIITITPSGGFTATVAAPYSQTFSFNGGASPWGGYQVTNLPAGLSVTATTASTVTISGTPTQAGTFILNVSATDTSTGNGPYTVGQAFALTVVAPGLVLDPAPATFSAAYATAFSQAFSASGGVGPYTYDVTGTLPAGLAFSGNTISGTPTAPGSYAITVTATDTGATGTGAPFTKSQNYTIDVQAPTITIVPTSLANPVAGMAYSQTMTANNGAGPYSFAVTAGSLPSGITLSSSGTLSGTAAQVGTFNFTVTATDNFGQTASRAYTVTVAIPALAMDPAPGTLSAPYAQNFSQTFTATGGSGTFSYVLSGVLPTGMMFSGNTLSGVPTTPGSYPIAITAVDEGIVGTGAPFSISQNYTLDVPAPTIAVTPVSLSNPVVGSSYSQNLSASGGAPAYSFAITAGSLPAGIALDGASLSGTTYQAGTFNFTVTATDGNGQTGSRAYAMTVAAPVLAISPGAGTLTAPYAQTYSQSFSASGGSGTYSYALIGALPTGLSFNPDTALISGTASASGNFNFAVTATDTRSTGVGAPFSATVNYTLAVAAPTITVTPENLPNGSAGQSYSVNLTGTGAVAPYTFTVASGTLPPGVTLSSAGQLAGTPTASGIFPFTVLVRDVNGQQTSVGLSLTIAVPTLTVTPASLPAASFGIGYSQQLTVSGGIAPYNFTVTTGSLPAGLVLNATTGVISGTPSAAGSFPFAITVRDSTLGTAATATITYSLQVQDRPDPAADPEVRGLVQAQAEATKRFASTQINNFQQRLERLHRGGAERGSGENRASVSNSVRISTPNLCRDTLTAANSVHCGQQHDKLAQFTGMGGYSEAMVSGSNVGRSVNGIAAGGTSNDAKAGLLGAASSAASDGSATGSWGIWTAGLIRFGDQDARPGRVSYEFQSEGVTVGADYRFDPTFAAGLGIGFGRDTVDIGNNDTRSRAEAKTVAAYASYLPSDKVFVDALWGYQWLDFDLRRFVGSNGTLVSSSRTGYQWFGSVSLGADLASNNWQFTPYVRFNLSRAHLHGFVEGGGSAFDLRFLDQRVDSTTFGLGTRVRYSHDLGWGLFYPELRGEYHWQLERNGDALVGYADSLVVSYSAIRIDALDRNELTLGSRLNLELDNSWLFAGEYISRIASGSGTDSTIKVMVSRNF